MPTLYQHCGKRSVQELTVMCANNGNTLSKCHSKKLYVLLVDARKFYSVWFNSFEYAKPLFATPYTSCTCTFISACFGCQHTFEWFQIVSILKNSHQYSLRAYSKSGDVFWLLFVQHTRQFTHYCRFTFAVALTHPHSYCNFFVVLAYYWKCCLLTPHFLLICLAIL